MRSSGFVFAVAVGFAFACGGTAAPPPPPVTPVATAPPPTAAPAAAAPVVEEKPAEKKASTTTAPAAKAASGPSCCRSEGDWGEQWSLSTTEATCGSRGDAWVSGKECEKVCCNTNDESLAWSTRGSCRQFGMWANEVVDAAQCKGLGLDDTKALVVEGRGEPADEPEDELELPEDLDLDGPATTGTRTRPGTTGTSTGTRTGTRTRPK